MSKMWSYHFKKKPSSFLKILKKQYSILYTRYIYPGPFITFCNILCTHFIFNAFHQRSQMDVLQTDFQKTSDLVNYNV